MAREAHDLGKQEIRPAPIAIWEPPRFEVISLDCEITSYVPDDRPLL